MVQAIIKARKCVGTLFGLALLAAPLAVTAEDVESRPPRAKPTAQQLANEALFKEGMQALDEERLKSAIRAFGTILENEPQLHRAKLELALAYYRSMRYEEAERLAGQVLDDPLTPPEVRVTILAFLAQVKRDSEEFGKKHSVTPFLSAGIMHDSNVNVGPTTSGVRVGEIEGTLALDSQAKADNAYVGNVGFDHLYQPGRHVSLGERTGMLVWQSGGSVNWRRYHEENDFDTLVATLSTGPAVLLLREWRANLELRTDYLMLGSHALGWFNTLAPSMTWQFDNGEFMLDANYTHRSYHRKADKDREGNYADLGGTLGRYVNDRKMALTAGARILRFGADDSAYSYIGAQLSAGMSTKSWRNGTFYARGRFSDYLYQGELEQVNKERHELEYKATLGFTHEYKNDTDLLQGWVLSGFWERTFNDSNVSDLYTYNRYQGMLTLSRSF